MKEEFITKDYFDAAFDRFGKKFDAFSDLVTESFAYLNVKIDGVEERLGRRISGIEDKLDLRFDQLSNRVDDVAEHKVSRPEYRALESRVTTLEKVSENA